MPDHPLPIVLGITGASGAPYGVRLLEVLLSDGLPDPRDCCLMSLAETCGIIRQIVPQSELKQARERIAKFSKMELIGQNVNHYIEIFERAMALATPAHM